MKKFTLILLSAIILISLISCNKKTSKEESSSPNVEVTETVVEKKTEPVINPSNSTSIQGSSNFTITANLQPSIEEPYSAGTYPEVDKAINLYTRYLLSGEASVASELIFIYADKDFNYSLVPLTDKYLKKLELGRLSIENSIDGKIIKLMPVEVKYCKKDTKINEQKIDGNQLVIKFTLETDSGNQYNLLSFIDVYNYNNILQFQIFS